MAVRVWNEMNRDDIFGDAAKLAYYFLLALFPLLIFLTSAIGMIVSGTSMRQTLFQYLARVMPSSAFQLIDSTMLEVTNSSSAGKLSFGLLLALWAASNGMGAITEALNTAYDVEETRAWWKRRLAAVLLTVGLSVLIIAALALVIGGGRLADYLAAVFGFSSAFTWTWKILQWPLALAFMLTAFALIYYFAPDVRDQHWMWITPGAVIGITLWLLASFGLKSYLHFFNSYSTTYGTLGAVIILMLWLYLTGAAILIGGEVNSEIENAPHVESCVTILHLSAQASSCLSSLRRARRVARQHSRSRR